MRAINMMIRQLLSVMGKLLAGLGNRKREPQTEDRTPVMGKPEVSAGQIAAYIISKNPAAADDANVIAHFKFAEKEENYRDLAESMKSEEQAKNIFLQAIEKIIEDGYRKSRELQVVEGEKKVG